MYKQHISMLEMNYPPPFNAKAFPGDNPILPKCSPEPHRSPPCRKGDRDQHRGESWCSPLGPCCIGNQCHFSSCLPCF